MCSGTSVLPDDGHYEAYTPLARVRTIAHPRRGAQQERAASPPRSSSLCNSGHFLNSGAFLRFWPLSRAFDANWRETWHFLIGRLIISLSFSFFSLFHTAFTLLSRGKWGLRTVECSGTRSMLG